MSETTAVQSKKEAETREKKGGGRGFFRKFRKPVFHSFKEKVYYTLLYAVYMYGKKAWDRRFWGFKCREYEDRYVYISRAMGRYICTKYYRSDMLYWLSVIARCSAEYGGKGRGFYIFVKRFPEGFRDGFKKKIRGFVEKNYPGFYEALNIWFSRSSCSGECIETIEDLEPTNRIDYVPVCPTRSVLHIRVRGDSAYAVYTGLR